MTFKRGLCKINSAFLLHEILRKKKLSNMTYKNLADLLNKKEIYVASVLTGKHPFEESDIEKIYYLFNLKRFGKFDDIKHELTRFPALRNQNAENEKHDPAIARLNEIVKMYGISIKKLIEEKCGDGIMSAIDCKLELDVENAQDGSKRIILKIDSKFLGYSLN